MSSEIANGGRRAPILVVLAFQAAVLLAFASAAVAAMTFVPDAERGGLRIALGCGASALVLLGLCWRRLPRGPRVFAVATAGLACAGIGYAALRLVAPQLLG